MKNKLFFYSVRPLYNRKPLKMLSIYLGGFYILLGNYPNYIEIGKR